jgi:hypothetical protein
MNSQKKTVKKTTRPKTKRSRKNGSKMTKPVKKSKLPKE